MARYTTVEAHAARLAPHLTIVRPGGAGPHPVVIQLHGCGGRQPLHDSYAEAARAAGIASLIIDSFAPRSISRRAAQLSVCTGLRLRAAERSSDIFAVLRWLEGQTWADSQRLALAGWSHGGWTVMDAFAGCHPACGLIDPGEHRLERVRAAFLVYPYAGIPSLTAGRGWTYRPKVAAVLCTRDAVVGHRLPARALDRLKRDGIEIAVETLAGATHGFDDPDADDPRTRYDGVYSARSRSLFVHHLTAALV